MCPCNSSAECETEGPKVKSKGNISRGAWLNREGRGSSSLLVYGVWPAWHQMQWPDNLKDARAWIKIFMGGWFGAVQPHQTLDDCVF